jgi:hypothetical protein
MIRHHLLIAGTGRAGTSLLVRVAPTRAATADDEAISSPDYCTAGTDLEQIAKPIPM